MACDVLQIFRGMERVMGIEPTYSAWKAAALPLSYTRYPVRLDLSSSKRGRNDRFRRHSRRVWWRGLDSNQRRHSQRVYSPSPLATRAPLQSATRGPTSHMSPNKIAPRVSPRGKHRLMLTGVRAVNPLLRVAEGVGAILPDRNGSTVAAEPRHGACRARRWWPMPWHRIFRIPFSLLASKATP